MAYAVWSPLRERWELLTDQFKLLAEGVAYQTIPARGQGLINLWWLDPAGSGTLVDSGLQVSGWNWLHPLIGSGEKVIVSYDRQEDRWTILAADFTTRPQSLNVVTSATAYWDYHMNQLVFNYTTQSIQLPPWTTIGPPVTH